MSEQRATYRRRFESVARGNSYGSRQLKQVSVQFDEEMARRIRARAVSECTSFTEQVRLLCEWGLEADEKA